MPNNFIFQNPFPVSKDDKTDYYLLTKDYVSTAQFEGKTILKIHPDGLTLLARTAMSDCAYLLRTEHQKQVASILTDPEASKADKYVALTMLRNAEISAKRILPFCQDTGTATVYAKKGQNV
jgi:fumarate hydratase class I